VTGSSFYAMGCRIRLLVDDPAAADRARRWLHDFDARMSRFREDSELCALNRDPRAEVPASALLRATVNAGLWAARATNGLVDPTLLDDVERAGYSESLGPDARGVRLRDSAADALGVRLCDALTDAPARRPARPSPEAHWRDIEVDDERGLIRRPPGIRIDSGGAGKGLAADGLAHLIGGDAVIDCGGDIRVVGAPFGVEIADPFTGEAVHRFALGDGAVATSGIGTRIWRTTDGGFAHHLIDPSSGRPAWTGVVQATAIASTALEAETLSKAALLSGPEAAREILAPQGGAFIHDDGSLELAGALRLEEVAA
jgi:FAD:protein FMN transferase